MLTALSSLCLCRPLRTSLFFSTQNLLRTPISSSSTSLHIWSCTSSSSTQIQIAPANVEQSTGVPKVEILKQKLELLGIVCDSSCVPGHYCNLLCPKVEKQCCHFYSVEICESEARAGLVCQVHSSDRSKFKLLYFDREDNGGLGLCLQEDSAKTGKVTSAGMYFLGFPVYRLDHTLNSMAAAKDPDSAFFKKLDGFQPCELTELKAGTHVFAVYGDNFFKSATYTIEVLSCEPFPEEKESLRAVEAQILTKRVELSKFETEYREVLAQFTEMTSRYTQEMQEIDELLKQRNEIHALYTTAPPIKRSSSRSRNRGHSKEEKEDAPVREKKSTFRDRTKKKKWFNIHLKVDKRKPC